MTNEELQQLVLQQSKDIESLQNQMKALANNATIPFDIGKAMKARVLNDAGVATTSSKTASSENQGVNEAGADTYAVLRSPDGFLQITILGTTYYVPSYT